MKTMMKLMVGAAAAMLMATGCGGETSPEEACEKMKDSLASVEKEMSSCLGGEDLFDTFDTQACVAAAKECSADDLENVVAQMDCGFDLFTCDAFESDAAFEELMTKLAKCEKDHPVSASCQGPDVGLESVGRQAMSIRAAKR
jgi:hypothetical protein